MVIQLLLIKSNCMSDTVFLKLSHLIVTTTCGVGTLITVFQIKNHEVNRQLGRRKPAFRDRTQKDPAKGHRERA